MSLVDLNTQDNADLIETFMAYAPSVAPAQNKSMISITNTSATKIAKIRAIYLTNPQTTAVNGAVLNFELRRIVSHSAGTSLTPIEYDTSITLDSGITARTGSTVVTEGGIIRRWVYSSDDHGVGANDVESFDYTINSTIPIFQQEKYSGPLVLRQNQGITLKQTISSTVGVWDINVIFSQE
jgi:hypothetical protein